jgi:hypothetical protein
MKKSTRTAIWVVAGIVVCTIVLFVGGAVWFFTSAIESSPADAAAADLSIEEVRGRFRGMQPVMAMEEKGPVLVRQPPNTAPARDLKSLHIIGWDPEDQRLAHVTIPYWLVRLKPGDINLSTRGGENVRVSLSVDDLERYGPALVMDHTDEDGEHILIWTE